MQSFPLQHKKLQRLGLPYLRVGTCEILNTSPYYTMDTFHAYNAKNTSVYRQRPEVDAPFVGQMVAGGLVDSFTGGAVSRFIASYLSRALSMHTIVPSEMRELRKEFPDDPLIDLMMSSTQRHRALHQPHLRHGHGGGPQQGDTAALRSVVSDYDMHQYAFSADAAFFNACRILQAAQQRFAGNADSDDGIDILSSGSPSHDHRRPAGSQRRPEVGKLSRYEKFIADELAKAIEAAAACSPSSHGAEGVPSANAVEAAMNSGCRAVWFTATAVPSSLELRRREALRRGSCGDSGDGSRRGMAPPPQKTLTRETEDSLLLKEMDALRRIAEDYPLCLDVIVGNLGDSRAFGIARNRHSDGSKSLLDPTRERVVPLSVDHRPFRQEEFHRITRAGGKVESAAGEVIDGNPFYNVSRSFGHWSMKADRSRPPSQQKMSALPHTAAWRMLVGDVLVLANHAVFQTRQEDDTSIDEIAKVVGRELDRGAPPEQIAAAVCDFAVRFGAPHSLQVMVAVATNLDSPSEATAVADETAAAATDAHVEYTEWVEPGPLYVEACRQLEPLRAALLRDCARCGVSAAEMIGKRWERVRDLLPLRHALPLMSCYGKECGALQQVMDEEAIFFDQDALRRDEALRKMGEGAAVSAHERHDAFQKLAKNLTGPTRR